MLPAGVLVASVPCRAESLGPGLRVSRAAAGCALGAVLLPQVFSQIRNEHFSSVFGFLSQKSRNLQAQYDVSATLAWGCLWLCPSRPGHHSPALPPAAAPGHGHQADEGLCVPGAEGTEAGASPAEPA